MGVASPRRPHPLPPLISRSLSPQDSAVGPQWPSNISNSKCFHNKEVGVGRILRPDKRIITTGQPTPSRPSVRPGLLPARPSISPGLPGRTLSCLGFVVRLSVSWCFLICLVLQVGLGSLLLSIKPSFLSCQFVQPILLVVLSSQVALEAGKHNTRTSYTTRLEVTRRCTVTRQVPGDARPTARRPPPRQMGIVKDPDRRGMHVSRWMEARDDACNSTEIP